MNGIRTDHIRSTPWNFNRKTKEWIAGEGVDHLPSLPSLLSTIEYFFQVTGPSTILAVPMGGLLEEALKRIGLEKRPGRGRKFIRFGMPKNLNIKIEGNQRAYFSFVRSQERYFLANTKSNGWKRKVPAVNHTKEQVNLGSPKNSLRFALVSRRSSEVIGPIGPKKTHLLDRLLHDSTFKRPDGQRPYPQAGDIDCLDIRVISRNRNIETATLLKCEERSIKALSKSFPIDLLPNLGLNQPGFSSADLWFACSIDLLELSRKYGPRAYRFANISSGAWLQSLLLSATSLGLTSKILGGFDDRLMSEVLGIKSTKSVFTNCLVAIGSKE